MYLQIELVESVAGEVPVSRTLVVYVRGDLGHGLVWNSICECHHCCVASG